MDKENNLRTIILDFDGTIVESVGIKDHAFETLFKVFPDHIDEIMAYHLSHNGTVRFEKFEYIFKNILRLPFTEEIEKKLGETFSELVFQKIITCPYVRGAIDFLDHFSNYLPLYLVSASPDDELDRILSARKLKRYFEKIYPVSWKKTEAFFDIIEKEQIVPSETMVIGDAYEDYVAANTVGARFIGRISNKSFFDAEIPKFMDLTRIKNFLLGVCHV